MESAGFGVGEHVAFAGELDGGSHVLGEGELAVVFLRVGESGDGAGNAAGFVADERHAGDDVALRVEVHVAAGCGGGFFAVVEEVGFAVMVADEHEASTADVAGGGIDDREGKAYGNGCVDGVAALFEDFNSGVGGVVLDGDDHACWARTGSSVEAGCCAMTALWVARVAARMSHAARTRRGDR